MTIERIGLAFSICKVENYALVDPAQPFHFTGSTDDENSLVCPTEDVPENVLARDDGWRAFRIAGTLDFSLVGILARICGLLAENNIGIFAISTYNTDYILTKSKDYEKALHILACTGYLIA